MHTKTDFLNDSISLEEPIHMASTGSDKRKRGTASRTPVPLKGGGGIDSSHFYRDTRQPPPPEGLAMRREGAARMLDISVPTLDRLVKAGEIPRVKLPTAVLFSVASLRTWLQSRETRRQST